MARMDGSRLKAPKQNRLVVGDSAWAVDLPEWLTAMVVSDRLASGLTGVFRDAPETIGDAEVLCYLAPASHRAPMPSPLCEVMVWITARVMTRKRREEGAGGDALPDFMAKKLGEGLSRDETHELAELRSMIYSKRGGNISHPLLDAMRAFKREVDRQGDGPVQQELFA